MSDYRSTTDYPTRVIIFPEDVKVREIPTRPYDLRQGDRRFFSQQAAVDWALEQQGKDGVQRSVRVDSAGLWLVQALGS